MLGIINYYYFILGEGGLFVKGGGIIEQGNLTVNDGIYIKSGYFIYFIEKYYLWNYGNINYI